MGTGAASPWQSDDGTDLLLTLMAKGGRVQSRPAIVVLGRGERKGLSADALVAKHRAYARGTGFGGGWRASPSTTPFPRTTPWWCPMRSRRPITVVREISSP
jgi:hypothetical protein